MKRYLLFLALFNILYFSEAQTFCPPVYGLVGSYPFSGNTNDVSGNNRNGTIVGTGISLTTDRFGNPNSAYDFAQNLGDGIMFPMNVRSVIGISLWFNSKGSNTATYPTFYILDDDFTLNTTPISSGYFYSCLIKETGRDDFFARVKNIGDDFTIPSLIQKDVWHHYYLEFDGINNHLKFYLDGSLVASKSTSSNIVLNNNYLRLGRQTTDLGNIDKFLGQMDDINVYNRTLSDCEIAKLYNCNSTCPGVVADGGLVANYPFCGNANDVTTNHLDGTITGSVILQPDRFNNPNTSYKFGGTSSDVIIVENKSNLLTLNKFSVSFWLKRNRVNVKEDLFLSIAAGGWGVYISKASEGYNNKLGLTKVDYDAVYSTYDLNDLNWHHCVVVFTGSQATFYLDGVKNNSENYLRTFLNCPTYSFGDRYTGESGPFNGQLDDFKIFSKVLSDSEITALYSETAPCVPSCPGTTSAINGNNIACISGQFNYSATSIAGVTYTWSVPGIGNVGSGNNVSFNWGSAGFKTLYAIPSNTCAGVGTLNITVACCGIIDSNFTVSYVSPVTSDCIATLSVTSSLPNNKYLWSTAETKSVITIKESGNYIVKTYNTCKSHVDTIKVTINKTADRIPNIITPNHDLVNDFFIYEGCFTAGTDFTLLVYNRLGIKVYESKSYKLDWDAEGLSDGVYYYSLTDNESRKVIKGVLQVLR